MTKPSQSRSKVEQNHSKILALTADDLFEDKDYDISGNLTLVGRFNLADTGSGSNEVDDLKWLSRGSDLLLLRSLGADIEIYDANKQILSKKFTISESGVGYQGAVFSGISDTALGLRVQQPTYNHREETVGRWALADGKLVAGDVLKQSALPNGNHRVWTFSVSKSGSMIVGAVETISASQNGSAYSSTTIVINRDSLNTSLINWSSLPHSEGSYPRSIDISPDESQIAIGGSHGDLLLISAETGATLKHYTAGSAVQTVKFSTTGQHIAVGFGGRFGHSEFHDAIAIWNIKASEPASLLSLPEYSYGNQVSVPKTYSLAWSPHDSALAVGGGDFISAWDLSGVKARNILQRRMVRNEQGLAAYSPYRVAYSSKGALAVSARNCILIFR